MLNSNLIPHYYLELIQRKRKTCIDTGSMNKAREAQIILKTVQEAGNQPIRRRHWQWWLPHLSSILEGRWQCKFFKAKPWILINISGCVPKLWWWPTIQLVQYLNFCATFLLPLYPRGHPHCVVAKGHVCDQRIQEGGIWTSKELHWILWIYQTNVCFLGKKMSPSKRVDDVDAFKNPIKGVWNDDGVGGHKRTEGWGFICRKVVLTYLLLRMRGGCLIRWCRYFMLHAPSFSEEPLEKKFLIYIVMVSFFIWATTTLTAWVEVQDSGTIFRIFQGWAPYKPPTHLSIYLQPLEKINKHTISLFIM